MTEKLDFSVFFVCLFLYKYTKLEKMQTLKFGSKGEDVKKLQSYLNLCVDGIFGKMTEESVKQFQKDNGLVSDGIVGAKTWDKLEQLFGGTLKKSARTINEIILHCSATPEGKDYSVDTIRKWHLQRGFSNIGYHYVIYRDGSIHSGRDVNISGAHCTNHNSKSIGVCYIGGLDFTGKNAKDTRTEEQKKSLVNLVKQLMSIYKLSTSNVHCHNEYANKACPSFKINDFRKELA